MFHTPPDPKLRFIINDLTIAHLLDELRMVGAEEDQLADLKAMFEQEMADQQQKKCRSHHTHRSQLEP